MNTGKTFCRAALLLIAAACSMAAEAQQTLTIDGVQFYARLDHATMTAELMDNGDYVIDDTKYPFRASQRKFRYSDKHQEGIVKVPATIPVGTTEYKLTRIGRAAFAGYSNMERVVIPETVQEIDDYAFFRSGLKSIELPASVTYIGKRVFGWCRQLRDISFPSTLMMDPAQYAESKGCNVNPYLARDVQQSVAARKSTEPSGAQQSATALPKPQPKQEEQVATSSEVDRNLPRSSSVSDNTFALIIANENYRNEEPVLCALNDGRTFRAYCLQTLGLPQENIVYLENATLGEMTTQIDFLRDLASAYEGSAKFIVYYAGHGIPNEKDKTPYLLPTDGQANSPASAYSLNRLYSMLGKLDAQSVTVFLDACFSGAQRGNGMLAQARGTAMKTNAEAPSGRMVVFAATTGDQTAWPYKAKGHGMFTYYLLQQIQQKGDRVTLGELADHVTSEVKKASIRINRKSQTPVVSCSPALNGKWKQMTLK